MNAEVGRGAIFLVGTRWFGVLGPCRRLIRHLTEHGYEVYVFGQRDAHYRRYDDGLATLVEIRMRRSYTTPLADLRDIAKIARMARSIRPVVIHSFNPKPALLSWASRRFGGIEHSFIGVTGLGNTFIRAKKFEPVVVRLIRMAARDADAIFFQNPDDVQLFTDKAIGAPSKYLRFTGPGVDLDDFAPSERDLGADGPVQFISVCRLLWQKGIREYVEAARAVRETHGDRVSFMLVGEYDLEHPDCVRPRFVDEAVEDGVIKHIPWTDDVRGLLSTADVCVLHSYREGAPRAILEASAMELPTIGSDAIGVRELVEDGVTGLLVPLKDVTGLADAMRRLADDPEGRRRMGREARSRVAVPLSLENATKAQLEMYATAGLEVSP